MTTETDIVEVHVKSQLQLLTATPPLVLVTGISGFIGSWVGYCCLKQGYRVRGTVRSLTNTQKVAHLQSLCPGAEDRLQLVAANLTCEEGWDAAVQGCTYILHVASPFPIESPSDKEELIRPAVDGTLHVLRAAAKLSPPPKRVVITSSVVAIACGRGSTKDHPFTEQTFTDLHNPHIPVGAYPESKTLAEQAAWEFVQALPADRTFELCTINPVLVQGPMLSACSCSSADVIKKMLLGDTPGLPDLQMDLVHVFDVAKAHVAAMRHPSAAGQRFMLYGNQCRLGEYANVLIDEFKPQGYKPTTLKVPRCIVACLGCLGDKVAQTIKNDIGVTKYYEAKNVKTILNLNVCTDNERMIKEMAYSAIANGLIPNKTKSNAVIEEYIMPEIDLSDLPLASDESYSPAFQEH